jgi:hypothetical protein
MTPTNLRALVERLRGYRGGDIEYRKLMDEAADRIEELEAGLRGVIAIPAIRQILGTNHVGGCDCPLCRARALIGEGR